MPIIAIPSLKWGKRKERSQMCESFTEDGRIVDAELDVVRTCIDKPDSGVSFLLDAENQFMADDNTWRQVIWERSCYPVCMISPGKDPDLDKLMKQIYRESKELAIGEQFKKAAQGDKMTTFLWVVSIFAATIIVVAGMRFLA